MSSLFPSFFSFLGSSLGKKILVALTGMVLVVFVLGHMIGNLLVYAGPDAINEYGHTLQTLLHGAGIWIARIGLLVCVVVHVVLTIQVTKENRAARSDRYAVHKTIKTTNSARIMILSGLTLLAFIVYHLLHFTVRAGNDYDTYKTVLHGETVHDVYRMVIAGFSWWPASLFYIIAMVLLWSHLSHGVQSMFQTVGISNERTIPVYKTIALVFATVILIGNCSIPISVMLGWVK
ncbi:succinate dehydrogenase / fumarate reductase cytochrome b subunit [Roseimicrobium gellanilyticum]|uniref:Succinate dehydrogenase / fumarate reductase cytochrome b subunit n=1 Tax=Roseimicrobium gellanilyticum TaxID=748857 RepID=A0A366HFR6_9BACT|nr:succinate dehydrogenase cytochrome b subunit [Roseimicrobium gellanilyticum]RBP41414.1 succinate dehydrogenase / fumarate reductase cytochrome b subunit [Roseimicrobium gellanilyticum]